MRTGVGAVPQPGAFWPQRVNKLSGGFSNQKPLDRFDMLKDFVSNTAEQTGILRTDAPGFAPTASS